MDSNGNLVHVSAKLPSYSGIKWCRHAYETRTKSRTSVSFSEFVRFVKEESDLANDPVFSPDALRREKEGITSRLVRGKISQGGGIRIDELTASLPVLRKSIPQGNPVQSAQSPSVPFATGTTH